MNNANARCNWSELTAVDAVARIKAGILKCRDLVDASLDRIGERNSAVRAWSYVDAEGAVARATEMDRTGSRGPLSGVTIGVKDIMDTADMPTTWGTKYLHVERSASDAAAVSILRSAGAIILGKTVSTELAYLTPPVTLNPHDLLRTPGGSSSGSAASVADLMVPIALGSQTAGSVTRPASYCGVLGFKPTAGSVPLAGVKSFSPSLDTIGWFTRDAADAALVFDVLRRRDPTPLPKVNLAGLKVAFCGLPSTAPTDQSMQDCLSVVRRLLNDAGASVIDLSLGVGYDRLSALQGVIMAFEAAWSYAYEYQHFRDEMGAGLRKLIETGLCYDAEAYGVAVDVMNEYRSKVNQRLAGIDILVAAGATGEAPPVAAGTGDPIHSRAWTLLGLPTVCVPAARGVLRLPVGVQLIGNRGSDKRLLAIANSMMEKLEGAT